MAGIDGRTVAKKGQSAKQTVLRQEIGSKSRGTSGGGAHFWGVDAEAEMGEVGLAEGHEAGIQVAPDEKQQEWHGGVV